MERPMTCSEAWTTMSATSRRTSRRADSRSRSISSRASSIWRLYSARSSRASARVFSASSMERSISACRSRIWLRIGGYTYLMSKNSRIRKVMTSQKIRLVLPRSKIPVGSICARSTTISTLSCAPTSLEHEGDEEGEDYPVERERLDQAYAQEHQRPGLVEGLGLAVDGGDGLAYEVAHPCSRPDDRGACRDADPDQAYVPGSLKQR